ncbi:MAG: endonuclease/exonuclease/phosphatase family protein [Deltaproteobacteria bacterium]|nr:endonuclease/exonuclease/phosphatase family protein [Deltaproteobacteria bacterium]
MRARIVALIAVALGLWGVLHDDDDALRVATFNIEYYPQTQGQAERAVDVIGTLNAPVIAVQEITDAPHLERTAQERLGSEWRVAASKHRFATAVLYDSDRLELISTREYAESVVAPNTLPTFEARFDDDDSHIPLRVIVIHLKAASDGLPIRKQQLAALAPVLAKARESGERLVVLGDFNATGDDDRAMIRALARDLGLHWTTEALTCTCFWQRKDDCVGSRLDHVLSSQAPASVDVAGACAQGCPATDRCPAWREEVSDHCPVIVEF